MNMREIQRMQQEMQRKLAKMQEELESSQFTGTAGGGAVTITMNGKFEMSSVKIDPEAFNAEEYRRTGSDGACRRRDALTSQ